MGEFDVAVEDIFANGKIMQEVHASTGHFRAWLTQRQPEWYKLKGKGKWKKSEVSGEVQLQFALVDTSDSSDTPQELLQKLSILTAVSPDDKSDDDEEDSKLSQLDSLEEEDEDGSSSSDESDDAGETDAAKPEKSEKKKRRLKARLRRKKKARTYEFSGGSDCVGIVFLEISRITDLPPEKNGKYSRSMHELW